MWRHGPAVNSRTVTCGGESSGTIVNLLILDKRFVFTIPYVSIETSFQFFSMQLVQLIPYMEWIRRVRDFRHAYIKSCLSYLFTIVWCCLGSFDYQLDGPYQPSTRPSTLHTRSVAVEGCSSTLVNSQWTNCRWTSVGVCVGWDPRTVCNQHHSWRFEAESRALCGPLCKWISWPQTSSSSSFFDSSRGKFFYGWWAQDYQGSQRGVCHNPANSVGTGKSQGAWSSPAAVQKACGLCGVLTPTPRRYCHICVESRSWHCNFLSISSSLCLFSLYGCDSCLFINLIIIYFKTGLNQIFEDVLTYARTKMLFTLILFSSDSVLSFIFH